MLSNVRATWLAGLGVNAILPERVVIVRNEGHAHVWRRDLARAHHPHLLAGTRFLTPIAAALEIVKQAGSPVTLGEEAIRAARISTLLTLDLDLRTLDLEVLRKRPGWERAIAATISELESAGFTASSLPTDNSRFSDLVTIWRLLDEAAAPSQTSSSLLQQATRLLLDSPMRWTYRGSVLAEITGHETGTTARFLRSIPMISFVGVAASPPRTEHARRIATLFGDISLTASGAELTERDLLARFLFAAPETLAAPDRRRSTGIDGTLHIEEHAGIEAEIDACVTWAIAEVAERATPLEQLAIVVPRLDPYASLLVDRFGALGTDAVHVIGGLPATGTASGARIATILRALESFLHLDTLVDVLPTLRLARESDKRNLSRRDAISLLYQFGTVGGGPANHAGARAWAVRRALRYEALETELALTSGDDDFDPERRGQRQARDLLLALAPAITALDAAAATIVDNANLETVWSALRALFADHVRLGTDGQRLLSAIDTAIAPIVVANVLHGEAALELISTTLDGLRLPTGRFGEAKLTIGALSDMSGLTFESVRILGLAEGVVPSSPREDPVLPDDARAALGVRRTTDRSLSQLHALHRVILGASRVVLSAPRMDVDRRYREPSGIMMEALAAIGRPPLGQGSLVIPDKQMMRRIAFEPARIALDAARERWPVDDRSRLLRASSRSELATTWARDTRFPLRSIPDTAPSSMDGVFPAGHFLDLPGLSKERPISASALSRLLECPHRFLYERVLGWQPPPELVTEGSIDALSYGTLFHSIAEDFFLQHGAEFSAKSRTLDAWQAEGARLVALHFARFVESYPLVGQDVRSAAEKRLRRDLRSLLASDWASNNTFFDVERSFGPMPLAIRDDGSLYVRGFIDRIDTIGTTTTLVRDLKTGRAKPRGDKLMPSYDVQVGLYGIVTREMATEWGVPARIEGAYTYPSDPSGDGRSFTDDFDDLAEATADWLALAHDLLATHHFPRTPLESDCQYCSFKPVCGRNADVRAVHVLDAVGAPLEAFRNFKLGEPDDD